MPAPPPHLQLPLPSLIKSKIVRLFILNLEPGTCKALVLQSTPVCHPTLTYQPIKEISAQSTDEISLNILPWTNPVHLCTLSLTGAWEPRALLVLSHPSGLISIPSKTGVYPILHSLTGLFAGGNIRLRDQFFIYRFQWHLSQFSLIFPSREVYLIAIKGYFYKDLGT